MSDDQVIPEAAVEAAMIAQYEAERGGDEWVPFAEMPAEFLDRYRASAVLILKAAAPHMLAAAWEAGAYAGEEDVWRGERPPTPNPYGSQR